MVVSRDKVRQCVERALLLDSQGDLEAAIASAAQALGLPVESVRECVEQQVDQEPLADELEPA